MTSPRHFLGTVQKALSVCKEKFGETPPDVAIVLGSGLSAVADEFNIINRIRYVDIPGFLATQVPGHRGECVLAESEGKRILFFCGRFHYYEGHSLFITTLPIRVIGAWGCKNLLVTSAAGGIRKDLTPGSLMLIKDHMNLMGANPLRGPNLEDFGPRFVDMTFTYDADHRSKALQAAKTLDLHLTEGVYAAVPGPSYETPAEINMLSTIGADAVGMSIVPEVIVARHHGIRVMGISVITNPGAGMEPKPLDHKEVMMNTEKVKGKLTRLLKDWILKIQ